MGELLWRTGASLVRWCHWPGRKPKEKHFFLWWDSCSISPAACSLKWHPKLWPQATRPWGWAFLEPLERLGIQSVHTSGMCSWIQNFPLDSGTWQSVGTVGIDSVWRGYSPYFLKWCFLLINTCSPRQRRSLCSTQAKRARSRLSWMNKPSVQVQMSVSHGMSFSVQRKAVNNRMWLGIHGTNWLLPGCLWLLCGTHSSPRLRGRQAKRATPTLFPTLFLLIPYFPYVVLLSIS